MGKRVIPYGRQHITEEDIAEVSGVLRSDYLTQGPMIGAFEEAFAEYVGARYAVAVNNATAGLHLGALALGTSPGDRVIVPSITFVASANCIKYCSGEVVFCDIDAESYVLDLDHVERLLEESPAGTYKGIIPVDLAGYPVDLERLDNLCQKYGLWIMEDACHAPGAYRKLKDSRKMRSGSCAHSDVAVFSFHPVKHIATGEGGMITTNDEKIYKRLLLLRSHGITREPDALRESHGGWYYEMHELGYNYRMTDIQAGLGLSQLRNAEAGVGRRQAIAQRYNEAFAEVAGIVTPRVEPNVYHAYHLYVIQVENRLSLYNYLREHGVLSQVHYIPVHLQPYYRDLGSRLGDLPVSEAYYSRCLSLPMYPSLTDEEQGYVIEKVKEGVR